MLCWIDGHSTRTTAVERVWFINCTVSNGWWTLAWFSRMSIKSDTCCDLSEKDSSLGQPLDKKTLGPRAAVRGENCCTFSTDSLVTIHRTMKLQNDLGIFAFLSGCFLVIIAPSAVRALPVATFQVSSDRFVDLSHALDNVTLFWPNIPHPDDHFTLTALSDEWAGKEPHRYYYRSKTYRAAEHGGTHLDAPSHFSRDGWEK